MVIEEKAKNTSWISKNNALKKFESIIAVVRGRRRAVSQLPEGFFKINLKWTTCRYCPGEAAIVDINSGIGIKMPYCCSYYAQHN